MRIVTAEFLLSAAGPDSWPPEGPPEVAFAGRSNVGKSSLMAKLMRRQGLVRISQTPGRTRLVNFFDVVTDEPHLELRLVDLPGYGFAKVSKEERKKWFGFIESYLGHRSSLRACVLIMDLRRGAELDETEIDGWLTGRGVAVIPVATKSDKLAKHARKPAGEAIRRAVGRPPVLVSAETGDGIDDLWHKIVRHVRGE
jgi:GTP-binding protein